jgi:lipoprotein NlpI
MRALPLVLAALTAALPAMPGRAEPQLMPICRGDDITAAPERRIRTCSAIIESPQETQQVRASAYFYRALAWRVLDELQRAIADLTEAIKLDPRHTGAYGWRGRLLADTGEYDRAVANYTDALKVFPEDDGFSGNRGYAHFYRADFAAAAADLHRAIQLAPYATDNADRAPMLYLARVRSGHDGTADLSAQVERWKSINRDIPLVVELYLGRGSPEAVIGAVNSLRTQCEANFYVGQWHLIRDNRAEARRLLQVASAKNCDGFHPTHPAAAADLKRMAS